MYKKALPIYYNKDLFLKIKKDVIERGNLSAFMEVISIIDNNDLSVDFINTIDIDNIFINEYTLSDFEFPIKNAKLKVYIKNLRPTLWGYVIRTKDLEYELNLSLRLCFEIYNNDFRNLSKILSHELTHIYDFESGAMKDRFFKKYKEKGDEYFGSRFEVNAKVNELIDELYSEYILEERFKELEALLSSNMNLILNTFESYDEFKNYLLKIDNEKKRRYAERFYKIKLFDYFNTLLLILKESGELTKEEIVKKIYGIKSEIMEKIIRKKK